MSELEWGSSIIGGLASEKLTRLGNEGLVKICRLGAMSELEWGSFIVGSLASKKLTRLGNEGLVKICRLQRWVSLSEAHPS